MMTSSDSSTGQAGSLADLDGPFALVGAGKMGGAMLDGWLRLGLDPARTVVVEPSPSQQIAALASRGLALNPERLPADVAVLVVAIKPQVAEVALPHVAGMVGRDSVVISIMAGRTLSGLSRLLPAGAAIVRAMPNLPASIGRGATVAVPNASVTERQRRTADRVLAAVGSVEWIGEEAWLDAVTAVSGSGPAYVFLLAEALARAGTAAGLPADLATRLARATVSGSGALLDRSSLAAQALRESVTSTGGTTAAALDVLMRDDGFVCLLEKAVAAAADRSRELAG
jgi:pyrroline-5-carboxylate reductase